MASMNLGQVRFVYKGEYDAETAYGVHDWVSYNGSSFVALRALDAGTTPVVGDTTYWATLAEKGETGADGTDGVNGADGADGQDGATGATGAQGEQGIQGPAVSITSDIFDDDTIAISTAGVLELKTSLSSEGSTTTAGLLQLATSAEVIEGTSNNRCVTPEGLFGAKTSITDWGFPSDSKINLGVINQYIAPACGFLGATSNTTNINSWLKITSNVGLNSEAFYNSAGGALSVYIAISKGQTGYINAYNGDIISVYFIYAQGEI